jgi:hypothetical protein
MNLTKKKWPKKIYLYLEKLNKKKERGFIQKINPGQKEENNTLNHIINRENVKIYMQ